MKLFVSLIFVIIICSNSPVYSQLPTQASHKFSRVLDLVNIFYVDTVNADKLVEHAIIEMLRKLDPHSVYISKEEVKEMNEPLEGSFDGIGVQFNIMDDTILVVNPIPGGPSEKLGIRAGDRIITIDGEEVAGVGIKNNDVFKKLRGEKGTQVDIQILRRNEYKLLDFAIIRDKIPIYSLDASYMIDKETGYIKLNRFSASTMKEFKEASVELQSKGAKNLVLDLQGNGGGYLNVSIDLANEFIDGRKLIVYTHGNNHPRTEYKASTMGMWESGRVVIMVDEGSASASEIVSGAVQDWDRGVIIGRRTFGKGLVQKPYNLPDGSMMRLTVAKYYTPTGRLIQKPYEKGFKEYSRDIITRFNNGELTNADSIHFPDSLKYETLINKRTVYGGGGIMPDIFVPIDTNAYTDLYRDILRKGIIYRYVLNYIDNNRDELNQKYKNFELFKKDFKTPEYMLDSILSIAYKDGVEEREEQVPQTKEHISLIVKALMARDFWNTTEYFQIMNSSRPEYNKAIEIITDRRKYNQIIKP